MSAVLPEGAIDALREGRWDAFVLMVRPLASIGNKELWKEIAAEHPASFNLFATLDCLTPVQRNSAVYMLLPAVGELSEFTVADGLRLLRFGASLRDYSGVSISRHLSPHIRQRFELGEEIGEALRVDSAAENIQRQIWAMAFFPNAPAQAAIYATRLMSGSTEDSAMLVALLQSLPGCAPAVLSHLEPHEQVLSNRLYASRIHHGIHAWVALAAVSEFSPTAWSILLAAIDSAEAEASIAMAHSLNRLGAPSVGVHGVPLGQIVRKLLGAALSNPDARQQVDSSIAGLLYEDPLRSAVVSELQNLLELDIDIVESFPDTYRNLGQLPEFIGVLTHGLLNSNSTVPAIRGLLSLCTGGRAPIGLDDGAFSAAGPDSWLRAVRRLLGLTVNGPALCDFISAISRLNGINQETRAQMIGEMLNIGFQEYPNATVEYLSNTVNQVEKSSAIGAVYRFVYASALRWQRVLAKLPERKELWLTDSEKSALGAIRTRFHRDVSRIAMERSVFRGVVNSEAVAQGRRVASHSRYGVASVTQMTSVSHSIELPSSEVADPLRGILLRNHLVRRLG